MRVLFQDVIDERVGTIHSTLEITKDFASAKHAAILSSFIKHDTVQSYLCGRLKFAFWNVMVGNTYVHALRSERTTA
jgi:hypothetical protein